MTFFNRQPRIPIIFIFGLFTLLSHPQFAQSPAVNAQSVAKDLSIPWDLEYWGTDTLIFTQKSGEIIRLDIPNQNLDTLLTLSNVAELQHSGLMGMALHPQWPDTKNAFVAYAFYDAQFQVFVRLQRLNYDPVKDSMVPSDILLDDIPGAATTTGTRVISTPSHLFISTGDINLGTVSQDTNSLNGKILRLNLDGSIPVDNPIPGSPVWSLGHRNPQGMAFTKTGKLFSCEHGASANDELNLIEQGRNYGWPDVSGLCNGEPACQTLNLLDPLRTWSPPIAPCGLAYVDTAQALINGLLMAGLRGNALYWIKLSNDQSGIARVDTLLPGQLGRIRDVLVTKDNRIFISTSNTESPTPISPNEDQIFELFTGFLSNEKPTENLPVQIFVSHKKLKFIHQNQFGIENNWNLYSLDGSLIDRSKIPAGLSELKVDLSHVVTGYYFISFESPAGQLYKKIYLAP